MARSKALMRLAGRQTTSASRLSRAARERGVAAGSGWGLAKGAVKSFMVVLTEPRPCLA
jgi:hypothetical protein